MGREDGTRPQGLQQRTSDEDGLPSQFTITNSAADRPYNKLDGAPVENPVGLVHGDPRLVAAQSAFEDAGTTGVKAPCR